MEERITEPCGVLCLDKPAGMTSHDAVNRIRRLFGLRRVGHTGTLDPMATGVLPILIGRAAKAAEYLVADRKRYTVGLQLGIETDTEDTDGAILSRTPPPYPSAEAVQAAAERMIGRSTQIPPMYSAIKIGGKKLVDLARQGKTVERTPREIEIDALTVTSVCEAEGRYLLEVACSKGTYMRTLCADLGRALGCGGAMFSLRRVQSGLFSIAQAVSPESLEALTPAEREGLLLPLSALFADCPKCHPSPFFVHLAQNGQPLYQRKLGVSFPIGQTVTLWEGERFFALARSEESAEGPVLRPIKQF